MWGYQLLLKYKVTCFISRVLYRDENCFFKGLECGGDLDIRVLCGWECCYFNVLKVEVTWFGGLLYSEVC